MIVIGVVVIGFLAAEALYAHYHYRKDIYETKSTREKAVLDAINEVEFGKIWTRDAFEYALYQGVYELGLQGGFESLDEVKEEGGIAYWVEDDDPIYPKESEVRENLRSIVEKKVELTLDEFPYKRWGVTTGANLKEITVEAAEKTIGVTGELIIKSSTDPKFSGLKVEAEGSVDFDEKFEANFLELYRLGKGVIDSNEIATIISEEGDVEAALKDLESEKKDGSVIWEFNLVDFDEESGRAKISVEIINEDIRWPIFDPDDGLNKYDNLRLKFLTSYLI